MRLLVCSIQPPLPPLDGFRLQVASLVMELRRRHEVRILALGMPGDPVTGVQELDVDFWMRIIPRPHRPTVVWAWWVARALLRSRPVGVDELAVLLRKPLAEELRQYDPDVVYVTHGQLAALGRDLVGRGAVLGALDAQHLNVEATADTARGLRRWLLTGESRRWQQFEAAEYSRFDRTVVVSEPDRASLQALDPRLGLTVIPNGVDTNSWAPNGLVDCDHSRIVFTGVMNYPPNIRAAEFLARDIFPRVQTAVPAARLLIVGRKPSPAVWTLAKVGGVQVVGDAPDLRPYLWGSRVFACPMITGTGIKNKLLEALAVGLPCVVTPLSLQGLSVTPGRELLVGKGPDELARQLIRVLTDDALARQLGEAARAYVCAHHQWAATAAAYAQVYAEVAHAHRSRPPRD